MSNPDTEYPAARVSAATVQLDLFGDARGSHVTASSGAPRSRRPRAGAKRVDTISLFLDAPPLDEDEIEAVVDATESLMSRLAASVGGDDESVVLAAVELINAVDSQDGPRRGGGSARDEALPAHSRQSLDAALTEELAGRSAATPVGAPSCVAREAGRPRREIHASEALDAESHEVDSGEIESDAAPKDPSQVSRFSLTSGLMASSRFEPLSPERSRELLLKAQGGDLRARNELVERNLRLVASFVRKYSTGHVDFEDRFMCGVEGLMRAIETCDPSKGRLSTYAPLWIRQKLQTMRERETGLPRYVNTEINKIKRELETCDDAEKARLSERLQSLEARRAAAYHQRASLDADITGDSDSSLHELVMSESPGPEELAEARQVIGKLLNLFANYPNRAHAEMSMLRLGLHHDSPGEVLSLAEVGERFNLTRERVRQISDQVLATVSRQLFDWADGEDNLPDAVRRTLSPYLPKRP